MNVCWFSHPISFSLRFCFCRVHQLLADSVQGASDSNLESLQYEVVYDAASTIDYSKEPIDAGVVDSPPPKKLIRPSPSPSPLKGFRPASNSIPGIPCSTVAHVPPSRRLQMDVQPVPRTPLRAPQRDALAVRADSDPVLPRARVRPKLHSRVWVCSRSICMCV